MSRQPMFTGKIRALTLWPEWAWAIHNLDKRVENRTWALPVGEWFALHAGKHIGGRPGRRVGDEAMGDLNVMMHRAGWTLEAFGAGSMEEAIVRPHHKQVDVWTRHVRTSAILGFFRVTHTAIPGYGDLTGWRVPEQVGNIFEYHPLTTPIPCSGAQGLWTVKPEIEAQIRTQVTHG